MLFFITESAHSVAAVLVNRSMVLRGNFCAASSALLMDIITELYEFVNICYEFFLIFLLSVFYVILF